MRGLIDDRATYTRQTLMKRIGISDKEISRARKSGIVKARRVGKQLMYSGAEFNQWIRSLPGEKVSPEEESEENKSTGPKESRTDDSIDG